MDTRCGKSYRDSGDVWPFHYGSKLLLRPRHTTLVHVVLTLDRATPTSQALSGKNHLDLAVSKTPNPLGAWTIYRIPVQDDGTDGTPNHGCPLGPKKGTTGPCLGDYPHIGADSNGIYLTTNEFSLFGPGFIGAQIYAISKDALAAGAASIPVFQYNTGDVNFVSATGL